MTVAQAYSEEENPSSLKIHLHLFTTLLKFILIKIIHTVITLPECPILVRWMSLETQ